VRSSFTNNLGTLIKEVEEMEIQKAVTGVAADLSQSRVVVLDVPDKPGSAAKLFGALAQNGISVDMIIQSYANEGLSNDVAFTVNNADVEKTREILSGMYGKVEISEVAKISIVGVGMIDRTGIASTMFETLAAQGINISMISTSEIKISCLIDRAHARAAIKALHFAFEMESDFEADVQGDLPPE
jgi:aspartate kinase